MSKIDDFFKEVQDAINNLIKEEFGSVLTEANEDSLNFMNKSKEKLIKWTTQLAANEITKDDFTALVKGLKALTEIHALTQAGLAAVKLERFRSGIIDIIINKGITIFLQ